MVFRVEARNGQVGAPLKIQKERSVFNLQMDSIVKIFHQIYKTEKYPKINTRLESRFFPNSKPNFF